MPRPSRQYPHLLPEDVIVWERWLATNATKYLSFDYDVRVGPATDPGDNYDPNIRKMASDLSRRRIDAVATTPSGTTLIEITRRAGLTAIGQLFAYPVLYRQTFPDTGPITMLLVCEALGTGVQDVLEAHNILWNLV